MTRDPELPLPPDDDRERIEALKRNDERRHFVFATILVMGCVLGLPVLGALYVLFVRWGWIALPLPK